MLTFAFQQSTKDGIGASAVRPGIGLPVLVLVLSMTANPAWLQGQSSGLRVYHLTEIVSPPILQMAFSPDGRYIAVGSTQGRVLLLDPEVGRNVKSFSVGRGQVIGLRFISSGARILAATDQGELADLDVVGDRVLNMVRVSRGIAAFAVSEEGGRLAWGGRGGTVEVLNLNFGQVQTLSSPNLYGKDIQWLEIGQGGNEVFAATADGRSAVWSIGQPDPIRTETLTRGEFSAVATDNRGDLLAQGIKTLSIERARTSRPGGDLVARAHHTVRVVDWARGRVVREIGDLSSTPVGVSWTADRSALIIALEDGTLGAWSVQDGVRFLTLQEGLRATSLTTTADGRWLAAGFEAGGGRVWRMSGAEAAETSDRVYMAESILGGAKFEFTSSRDPLIQLHERPTMALLGLANLGVAEEVATSTSELLISRVANASNVTLVERTAIDQVLQEVRFQNTGITSASDAARIGELLNADMVLLGSVNQLGTSTVISVRLVEVETARTRGAREIVCNECRLENLPQAIGLLFQTLVEVR